MDWLKQHRYLIARRSVQLLLIVLYFGANAWGWEILKGDLGASVLFGTVPLADPFALLQMSAAGALVGIDVWIGALIVIALYTLIIGRGFCSWVCPVNLVSDFAGWCRKVLRIDEAEHHVWVSRNVRYWVLGLSLLLSALFGAAAFELVSPIGILNRGLIYGIGFGGAVVAGVFLFDVFALKNGFCGHLCPLGAFYALLGRFSLMRIAHDHAKCTVCMKCVHICPEKQVLNMIGKRNDIVRMGECTHCARCIDVCADNAMNFDIRFFTTSSIEGVIDESK